MMYFPLYTDSVIPDYRFILFVIPSSSSVIRYPFKGKRNIRDNILEQRRLPGTIPPDNPHNLTLLHIK